eukprot:gene27529-36323_t
MPNITLIRDHLFEAIGRSYTDKEFDELCFEFGVEVDDIATEIVEFTGDGSKQEYVVYVIAIPANRYDLLCLEGFARALRIFLGLELSPVFKLSDVRPESRVTVTVETSTYPIRPFVACAILRGLKFDIRRYKSFIDLQEKLHQNICRKRSLRSDTKPWRPLPYTSSHSQRTTENELLNYYREDPSVKHIKPYTDLIYDAPTYPLFVDRNDVVLSLPPIINGKHSRITLATTNQMCLLCNKMQLGPAEYIEGEGIIRVTIPPTRSDILHAVDVIEDVAIAYGYNNVPLAIPQTLCVGAPLPINHFTDLIRSEIARAGYMEMLTHGLCSTAENFTHLLRPVGPAVALSNPANVEYEVGTLKTLAYNKSLSHKDGIKLFEISDVVIPVANEIGCKNSRRLVALYAAYSSGFEITHGIADRVMTCAQIQPEEGYAVNSLTAEEIAALKKVARAGLSYYVRPSADPCFFPGVVHPTVLQNFEVSYPCSVLELDIEAIM